MGFGGKGAKKAVIAAGLPISDAMDRISGIAAISVQASGTQTSVPNTVDLPTDLVEISEIQ